MNKHTLKTLGIGFLLAGILTGVFAIFGQGHVPVSGMKVNSLFSQNQSNEEELTKYRDQISKLQEEKATLEKERQALSDKLEKNKNNNSSSDNSIAPTDGSESTTDEASDTASEPAKEGTFTINSGETSSEIAKRLEEEGYIKSAAELQDLISQWDLDSRIVAADYELNSDMSVHQIAELITNGAYYYIP
ncbi:endolytic transglycosylase MltG [Tuanshanicoccus lijuaniae]|uniref:endolytic transglycosylase MltG n=1 Tax=Aerococcaceae bacterium zg-1292 TaxID=2774330 RepID=UPI001BD86712|nr:endolytic transglycosylase MltG [Aerococcaceae bacterium zg-A91]MBS4457630.1 endolytic transglycosylase MltG [Aerococcaceae bacterium zg-BR33]